MWVRSVLLLCVLLSACTSEPQIQKIAGLAQGTTYHISYWTSLPVDGKLVEIQVSEVLNNIDKVMSNYRPDSTIESFNANLTTASQEVGEEIVLLVRDAENIYQLSQGCFDLTVKPMLQLWGFQGDTLTIPDQAAIQQELQRVGMNKLQVVDATHLMKKEPSVQVDLSAIAQGYTIGKISQALEAYGIKNYVVEIGGEFKTNGHKPDGQSWQVAVEKPFSGERKIHKIVTMPKNAPMSVLTAGTYRHFFDAYGHRYSHVLDARTGKPITHDLVAVTVLHENPTIADAWSTALLCLGQQDGMQLANSEKINAIFIRQQDSELLEMQSNALRIANNLTIQ